jgi:hypothetical protein
MGPMSQINLFMAGTRHGKSVFGAMAAQLAQPSITVLDQTQVDEDQWYTLDVDPAVAKWARQHPQEYWYQYPGRTFRATMDVHEHLYTMLLLRWTTSNQLI